MTDLASNATADDARAARRAALDNLGEPELLALAYDAPVGLFAAVAPFGNVLVNKRMCEITGRRNRDLLGDLWFDAVHPDDREHLTALFRDAMDGDGSVENTVGEDAKQVNNVVPLGTSGVVSTKFGPVAPSAFNGCLQ